MQSLSYVSAKDLRDSDVFEGVSDESLEKIARLCKQHVYEPGEYCAVRGEGANHLLIINGGKVASEMQVGVEPHAYVITIAVLTKGRVGAWSAIVPPHVLTSSLKCIERAPVISIAASDLKRLFADEPAMERTVVKNLAFIIGCRLRDSHVQLEKLVGEIIKQGKTEDKSPSGPLVIH